VRQLAAADVRRLGSLLPSSCQEPPQQAAASQSGSELPHS